MIWRPADRQDRQVAWLWAVCAGLTVLLLPFGTMGARFLPSCAFRALTGWPCPGCGTTRAMLYLIHGDPAGALASNPLSTASALGFLAGGIIAPVWIACGGKAPSIPPGIRWGWIGAVAAVVVANWAWLVVSGV